MPRSRTTRTGFLRLTQVLVLLLGSPLLVVVDVRAQDLLCNTNADNCPTRFNGVCDRDTDPACAGGDCYDCDECQQFEADCEACIGAGCFWCPGDATCWNAVTYSFSNKLQSCTSPSDFETTTCLQPEQFFEDPVYSGQAWVYEMINVRPVWEKGIFGTGVRVRVNDNGVEASHPEFAGRFDTASSCTIYEPVPPSEDRSGVGPSHGTVVAAILGASANNGECSVGVAPEVTISSCYAFFDENFYAFELDSFDVSQNAFGRAGCLPSATSRQRRRLQSACPFVYSESNDFPCSVCDFDNVDAGCESTIIAHCQQNYENDRKACSSFLDIILGGNCLYTTLSEKVRDDVTLGIQSGRGGKGIVYVFSSGNGFRTGDDTNIATFTNSRFFITVGAVGKDRSHASYSTPGCSLFVTGPGGDNENLSNHVTAGIAGTCQDAGIGTSFSSPVVSGVIALVLEANPELTWRDVQEILAATSQPVDDADDDTGFVNAAGYWHSNFYGFGIVDADAAVTAAQSWTLLNPEELVLAESGLLNIPITDDPTAPVVSSLTVEQPSNRGVVLDNFVVESVEVEIDLQYVVRGHLEITLVSPRGTSSILHPGNRPENQQLDGDNDRWKLLTVRNWGEDPTGEWTLNMVDIKPGSLGACIDAAWALQVSNTQVDCNFITTEPLCVDGQRTDSPRINEATENFIFTQRVNGLLPEEACCSCGGGLTPDQVADQLVQWRLVMYGRVLNANQVPQVNNVTSSAPSLSPSTANLSEFPSESPSSTNGSNGTSFPSSAPSNIPSVAAVTDLPSESPSSQSGSNETSLPSSAPSNTPSVAGATSMPSSGPSNQPSGRPSVTGATSNPIQTPSLRPSNRPSQMPSLSPSLAPVSPPLTISIPTQAPVQGTPPTAPPSPSSPITPPPQGTSQRFFRFFRRQSIPDEVISGVPAQQPTIPIPPDLDPATIQSLVDQLPQRNMTDPKVQERVNKRAERRKRRQDGP